uniref:Uncharacterized protein n=1 Tax=Oryza brachyantha TaxID=4533 RepID=J3LJQ9_ORYBR
MWLKVGHRCARPSFSCRNLHKRLGIPFSRSPSFSSFVKNYFKSRLTIDKLEPVVSYTIELALSRAHAVAKVWANHSRNRKSYRYESAFFFKDRKAESGINS